MTKPSSATIAAPIGYRVPRPQSGGCLFSENAPASAAAPHLLGFQVLGFSFNDLGFFISGICFRI